MKVEKSYICELALERLEELQDKYINIVKKSDCRDTIDKAIFLYNKYKNDYKKIDKIYGEVINEEYTEAMKSLIDE